jgi:hypothetical protein
LELKESGMVQFRDVISRGIKKVNMAITADERRFLRFWEDQRKGGRGSFLIAYGVGLFFLIYMGFVAIGLFSGFPFVKLLWLLLIGLISFCGSLVWSFYIWNSLQKRFKSIVKREVKLAIDKESRLTGDGH